MRSLAGPLTNFPNGIDITDNGYVMVGNSHGNKFRVSLFDSNEQFVGDFECASLKVSRCCGLRLTSKGQIVTLAKNNHHVLVLDTINLPSPPNSVSPASSSAHQAGYY